MAANQKTATIKTLRKWEKEFQITLDFNTPTLKIRFIAFDVRIARNGNLESKKSRTFLTSG